MNRNGFTLIELLAVIIILGILMIIAIPSVTSYINDSRKSAYIDTAKEIIGSARNFVNEGKLEMYDTNATYYLDAKCIKTENAMKSPYGEFTKAYVVITYDGKGYNYYWTSVDETGQGIKNIVRYDKLENSNIESDLTNDNIKTDRGIGKRENTILIEKNNNCQKGSPKKVKGVVDEVTGKITDKKCIRATHLKTELCNSNRTYGCLGTGYAANATITFGSLGTEGTLSPGDAFDCDVNGDGIYDQNNERFFFITDYYDTYTKTFDSSVAVLLADKNYKSISNHTVNTWPQDSLAGLPTEEDWPNVSLYKKVRRIDNAEYGGLHISNFNYEGYAARSINYYEINHACTALMWNNKTLDKCQYFLSNTSYASGSGGYSLENTISNSYIAVVVPNSSYGCTRCTSNSICDVRPAIEVLKTDIDY